MILSVVSLGIVGLILVVSEYLLKHKILHGEISRKFVHIVAGTFIASWGFYLSTQQIQALSAVLLLGVILSKWLKVFGSVHSVTRKTWGEVFFAVSIGLTATLAPNEWVFAAAILHMSIADGLAAIVGTRFGKSTGYIVFGQYKTLVGSITFYLASATIMAVLILVSPAGFSNQAWLAVMWIPLLTTVTENIAINGIDNLAVPLVVVGALHVISQIYI